MDNDDVQIPQDGKALFLETQQALSGALDDPVSFVSQLLEEAIRTNASDVLIEPREENIRVRFRIDGILYDVVEINPQAYEQIGARVKIMAKLDTTEHKKVLEGQITFDAHPGSITVRVEVIKTIHGDMIVMRVLRLSSVVMGLNELGFNPDSLAIYQEIINAKTGLMLVCGPTGSGKTTTLYSTINFINKDLKLNVMTVEDPVEYQLDGVNQITVREEDGITFAAGLKAILRLSPDVILVGEIRDRETALIAVESGLTGHMVLSTVHSPDVVGVLFRLLDFNIELFLINSSLRGIVSQRLVRRVCDKCKTNVDGDPAEIDFFTKAIGRAPKQFSVGKGCEACQYLGYHGQVGIYEVLKWDASIRDLIRTTQNEDQIREALQKQKFKSLLVDGLLKAEEGLTTVSEVMRNSLRID